jgi:predicted AlkP superfamily phosphohydrolase/phosphomutase
VARFLHIGMDGMTYPLLRKFLDEGCLPTFSRLVARGTINRLLPSIPAWTPTNWSAQITGAHPGTHGLGGWSKHRKTDPMSVPPIQSWESRGWSAETVWDVAEEAGYRVLIDHFPVGVWPSPVKKGYVVAPGLRTPPYVLAGPGNYFCSPSHQEEREDRSRGRSVDEVEVGAPPGSSTMALRPAREWRNLADEAWEATLDIALTGGGQERLYLLARTDPMRVSIHEEKDASASLLELSLGEWSPFVIRDWGGTDGSVRGSMRFRWLTAEPGPTLHVIRSQVYATQGFAYPDSLGEELVQAVGPFFVNYTVSPKGGAPQRDAFLDDIRYQGLWEANVARYVQDTYGWDLHFCHWHVFDFTNHPTGNTVDPDGPDYDPKLANWNIDVQRRAYRIADEVLAEFLTLADDDSHVMVVSDHGAVPCHRRADLNRHLAERGLMNYDSVTREIDFSRSRAYTWPERGSEVFVNLAGREPTGIVPADQFRAVQNEIIDALLDWRDPISGRRVIALALRLEDAQIIGYWGADNGDVVCVFDHGMAWGATDGERSVDAGGIAMHGSQIPSYERGLWSTTGSMILAGPGVRGGGYERDWRRYGMIREVDVAPTICHLLGLRPPAQNQGAVPPDLLR